MDYKICSNCRNTNVPNANVCTNCGNVLEQTQNAGQQEPPPTIISNQPQVAIPTPPKDAKKSRKVFWILGIVGVLLVIGIGLISLIGIGGYLYYTTKEEIVEREYPGRPPVKDETPNNDTNGGDDESPLSDIEFPATGGDDGLNNDKNTAGSITNEQLIAFYKLRKSKVGGFRLQTVVKDYGKSNFPNRVAGVKVRYKKGSTRLNHNFAAYASNDELKDDFDIYKRKVKSNGGKITKSTATSVIYIKGPSVYFAFYNPQGGFHEMSSRKGKDILTYHDDYFGIKKK